MLDYLCLSTSLSVTETERELLHELGYTKKGHEMVYTNYYTKVNNL